MSKLIYYKPAKRWKEALPLGNGKTGAMVYGGIRKDIVALNDSTLWSGYPCNYNNPESAESLDKARKLIFEGKYTEASAFVAKKMRGEYGESYLPLADVVIRVNSFKNSDYKRVLDLESGIHYIKNGDDSREAFVSYPASMMFYKMNFKKPRCITISMAAALKSKCKTFGSGLLISGNAPSNVVPNYVAGELNPIKYSDKNGMAFAAIAVPISDGKVVCFKNKIKIYDATYLILKIASETGFKSFDEMPSTDTSLCEQILKDRAFACDVDYENEKNRHISDYQALFSKQKFDIFGEEEDVKTLLKNYGKVGGDDRYLENLFYNYGKYLIVSGSRDSQPLNLQGMWNKSTRPPWSSNLTTNINYEMNYWGAAGSNLGACLQPFYKTLAEICQNGKKTAIVNFGANGFCCNHNVDIWRMTSPVRGNPAYMYSPLCGVFIANDAYAHSVTENGTAIKEVAAIVEEACKFCLDYLTEFNGKLVTCPSTSPEAEFYFDGKRAALGYASAFDTGIIMQCFENTLQSSDDGNLKKRVAEAMDKLYGFVHTSTGINEWQDDKQIVEKGHRHFSPLYALYPAKIIGYYKGGVLLKWAKELFDYRIANSRNNIGWNAAWAICISARLHDAERAYYFVKKSLKKSVFPNLFGYHPPSYFQIDGNLGYVAGVNEMLFYEEDGIIDLLPAVPQKWFDGDVSGHKINGVTISIKWRGGEVTSIIADKAIKINGGNIAKDAVLKNVQIVSR